MLYRLMIQDFALIDKMEVEFHQNLNVLSGETGAGKSIIIDAVSLLLGARGQSEFIRANKDRALVEGIFFIDGQQSVIDTLKDLDLFNGEDLSLILTREITATGRNVCKVNNRVVTLGVFREIGSQLINIYGQHDYQALSQSEKHIEILDSLGSEDHQQLKKEVAEIYQRWVEVKKEFSLYSQSLADKALRLDFLKFQIAEIEEVSPVQGEEEQIEKELSILNNLEKIVKNSNDGYNQLYGSKSVYDQLSEAVAKIQEIAQFDPMLAKVSEELEEVKYQIEDSARTLGKYCDGLDFDTNSLETLQERKFLLNKIKRKYGCHTINDLIILKEKIKKELADLEQSEIILAQSETLAKDLEEQYNKDSQRLSDSRGNLALILEEKVTQQLLDLSMAHTIFKVNFAPFAGSSKGREKIEFLISSNPGEPLRPLAKIASGGEMSRIMLAFKVILADTDTINTLIFDEVDAGIGGNVLAQVAEKLYQVSLMRQVLCVTHSPRIASLAHNHLKITKVVGKDKTITRIRDLAEEERVEELTRMLGDNEEATIYHAREMLKKGLAKQKNKN